jgi:ubiquinone/menaquinone biosynthesis C-methylase UbiE
MSISYGAHVADDTELRLCGDLAGKRVIELGIAPSDVTPNAIVMAQAGAKAIAIDPSAQRIAALRAAAERAEVRVECHTDELAGLGFAPSASVDLVVAAHTLHEIDDLPRLLRQVHRVLKPGAPFVVALGHPVAAMFDGHDLSARRPYGATGPMFGELYMAFERTDFHIDAIHELTDRRQRDPFTPAVLVLRSRKLGV